MAEDKLHESRAARVLAPLLALLGLGLIAFVVIDGANAAALAGAGLALVNPLLLLIRTRRPMNTWPKWLFTVKR